MPDKSVLHIVATACKPKDEVRFNKWYNEVHIPLLMKFKGIVEVARYKIAAESAQQPKYIALYKFNSQKDYEALSKSPEFAAAMKEMKESWGDGEMEIKYASLYELIKEWKR
jgi:uncharacterized protein (TIGR02118 family)